MHPKIEKELNDPCEKTIDSLGKDLAKLRTGRASVALLDHVKVDYYGTVTPLKQMANITIPESRQLLVTPWDQTQIAAIEKAILTGDLGLNPSNDGKAIRITIPALTEERRKDLAKVAGKLGEATKVAIRNHRKKANDVAKQMLKDKEISEDDSRKFNDEIQKITDNFTKRVDQAIANKEKEILEI